ncbi:hypothetical protein [Streptomyces sp. GS7]|uniref:hypothetical protein n=1 Tax=Streptomyces sp. GS7 TaxID=2692234 RepID=UPI0013187D16|nr:hypothetical protein [Streptomyces sp. GS7]QHC23269.1 hypothetical protein GR130_19540 [Streptomyces sp. GS7]
MTVFGDEGGRQVLGVTGKVQPVHHTEDGPCGRVGWWQTPVTLTATGRLEVR